MNATEDPRLLGAFGGGLLGWLAFSLADIMVRFVAPPTTSTGRTLLPDGPLGTVLAVGIVVLTFYVVVEYTAEHPTEPMPRVPLPLLGVIEDGEEDEEDGNDNEEDGPSLDLTPNDQFS